VWKFVPSDYYTYDLEKRRQTLGAANTYQLTKSVLFENIKSDATDCSDRTNSRYYLVVVQYEAEINGKKLASEIRALRPVGKGRLPPNKFEFRLASSQDNDSLTGYRHNSVTPFGLLEDVPVLMASAIRDVKPAFIFMGGGHVDLKLGMAVEEFVQGTNAIVADVSDPRSGAFKEE
jgi:prolyl-tRNA editing enzyme YbaK/EbsC (Cys-tRNA(Pro) deacylase)